MALAKNTVPTYTFILPSSKEKIPYRPFLMKEEKILLMAAEGTEEDIVNAVNEVLRECTFGKVSAKTNPLFDIQYAFLQIRSKSVGEIAEFDMVCGKCSEKLPAELNIASLEVLETPGHTKLIDLDNNLKVVMRYPKLEHLARLNDNEDVESVCNVIAECIDTIITEDENTQVTEDMIGEAIDFLDSLTPLQFAKIRGFFATMPRLEHTIRYTCPKCQTPNVLNLINLISFFG